jgi:hypothetical protein
MTSPYCGKRTPTTNFCGLPRGHEGECYPPECVYTQAEVDAACAAVLLALDSCKWTHFADHDSCTGCGNWRQPPGERQTHHPECPWIIQKPWQEALERHDSELRVSVIATCVTLLGEADTNRPEYQEFLATKRRIGAEKVLAESEWWHQIIWGVGAHEESEACKGSPSCIRLAHNRAACSPRPAVEPAQTPISGQRTSTQVVTGLGPHTFEETAEHFKKVTKSVDWPQDEPDVD